MDLINNTLGYDYIIDEKLNDLLKNKTIAYVGPAPNIQNLKMGSFIDSHDVVIRVGDPPVGFLGQHEKEIDYGSRTDVLVHSFNMHDINNFNQDLEWLKARKYLFQAMLKEVNINRHKSADIQTKWFASINVPLHQIPDHHINYLRIYLSSLPNTGFVGLLALLNYDVKSIYITGITFFNMGQWDNKENYYFDEWYGQLKNQKYGLNKRGELHNPVHDIEHFKKILKTEKHRQKIILDEYLTYHFDPPTSKHNPLT